MNQILVTEKLYITPELRRKKKIYRWNFIISLMLIVALFSFYVYAEYDRDKNEDISQDILTGMKENNTVVVNGEDNTTISSTDNVWIVAIEGTATTQEPQDSENNPSEQETPSNENQANQNNGAGTQNRSLNGTYKASNGRVYNTVGTVNIPSINVNYPILSETSESLLKVSVCKFWGPNPNEVGNLCIAGHNYRNSRFFSKAVNMVVGDTIEITDLSGRTLVYAVYDKYTVDPTDVSCTSQLTNGKKIVTLITCTNDSKQRVVIKAQEKV